MDPRITEFHCIMPITNIGSVMAHGILSYERAARLQHHSVALQPVQDRRDAKRVPGGLKLHQYANLYFHARNPMMFKRRDEANGLCILRVSVQVLNQAGTVITDCNAASDYVRFLAPAQWRFLNLDDIYAEDWRHRTALDISSTGHASAPKSWCHIASRRSFFKVRMSSMQALARD